MSSEETERTPFTHCYACGKGHEVGGNFILAIDWDNPIMVMECAGTGVMQASYMPYCLVGDCLPPKAGGDKWGWNPHNTASE